MFAARAIRRVPVSQVFARRAMSGGGHSVEQLQAETVTWKKLSYGKLILLRGKWTLSLPIVNTNSLPST